MKVSVSVMKIKVERENNHLKEQQNGWQERLQALLGRMEEV